MNPPEFKKGNRSFIDALRIVVEYAKRHGVNARGVTGWSQTPEGWQPPRFKQSAIGDDMWDLIKVDTDVASDRFQLYNPTVIKPRTSPPEFLSVSYETPSYVTLSAACYIVLKIADFDDPEIVIDTVTKSAFESGGRYTFSGPTMTLAQIPIWYISTTAESSRFQTIRIGEDAEDVLYGVKLVPPEMLRVFYSHTVDGGDYKSVLDLI